MRHPRLARARRRAALLLLALGAAACRETSARAAAADTGPAGTKRMADTLAAIAARIAERPMDNPFANRERAAYYHELAARATGAEALNHRVWEADELLKAGDTRPALDALKAVVRDAGLERDTVITPQRKPLYDLLALAYLRLGEQENCLDNPGADVCILPLAGGARHVRQEGARGAIATYQRILAAFPDDHGAKYLLNLAYLALGEYPERVPRRWLVPGLAPAPTDSFPRYRNVAANVGLAVTGLAGGLSVDDFDGDGRLDVVTTAWGPHDAMHVFRNDGRGHWDDRTAGAGLDGITGGNNTADADYDNDGDVDILVLRGGWLGEAGVYPKSLLRNRGDGTFEDVTFAAGLVSYHPSQTAAWADFDLDGWVDLAIGNESQGQGTPDHPSELWHNNGDGTFTEVSRTVGIDLNGFVKGVAWGDVNNDGLPDLYASLLTGPNRLYVNKGGRSIASWRFEERAAAAGVERPLASFPTWFWDFDDDGWQDLLVLAYDLRSPLSEAVAREQLGLPLMAPNADGHWTDVETAKLYRNRGDGTFEDASARVGLAGKAIFAMGSNFGDLDNDGWLDFYAGTGNPDLRSVVPNRMFRNVGGSRFEEVTLPGGFGHIQKGHATAFADLDGDGDEDVFMMLGGAYQGDRFTSVLFENPGWPANAWIALQLVGKTANRSAIGARVELDVEEAGGAVRTLHRTVGTGGSFGNGSLTMHVGLGPASRVREVRVKWPDRARTATSYSGLDVRRTYRLVQGAVPVAVDRPAVPFGPPRLPAPSDAHAHH